MEAGTESSGNYAGRTENDVSIRRDSGAASFSLSEAVKAILSISGTQDLIIWRTKREGEDLIVVGGAKS